VTGLARSLGVRLPDGVTVVDNRAVAERYVAPLAELRRRRGWTEEMARDHLADPIMVGAMMLQQGEVDGMVAGAVHTTAATVRPALQILGTRPGRRLVSSVFFMCLPGQVSSTAIAPSTPGRRRRPRRHRHPERRIGAGRRHRAQGGDDQLQHRYLRRGQRCREGRRGDPDRA